MKNVHPVTEKIISKMPGVIRKDIAAHMAKWIMPECMRAERTPGEITSEVIAAVGAALVEAGVSYLLFVGRFRKEKVVQVLEMMIEKVAGGVYDKTDEVISL